VIEEHNQVRFPLDNNREIGVRNEQMFANVQHRAAHIVHAHDQLRRRLELPRNLRQYVTGFHDVFGLLRRGITRQQNINVHFPEQIPRFVKMLSGGIFLDERDERIASFC